MSLQFKLVSSDAGKYITVYTPDAYGPADESHPNFEQIVSACFTDAQGGDVDVQDVIDLFDIAATVGRKFQRLSERVSVRGGTLFLDGDPVDGSLQQQILDFLDAGEDFAPLVNFYEKLLTNPLGNVRDGLFSWIKGQRENGNFTITPDGDVLGYKSVQSAKPAWRTDEETVYIASRASRAGGECINGVEVKPGQHIEQVPGDTVEMPRSMVLNEPSADCGTGLHIGTYSYAETFTGDTVMLVQFSPRDIVSLPDNNSSWKLRVCRYTVIKPVDGPLDVPVYQTDSGVSPEEADVSETMTLANGDVIEVGSRVKHLWVGATGSVTQLRPNTERTDDVEVRWDESAQHIAGRVLGTSSENIKVIQDSPEVDLTFGPDNQPEEFQAGDRVVDGDGNEGTIVVNDTKVSTYKIQYDRPDLAGFDWYVYDDEKPGDASGVRVTNRPHGKGGPTSQAAKGNGRNPAQDEKGRFSAGRPGSLRDPNTGRFTK